MFRAVVMAGGEGSRLRPLTSSLPKPMMPVANRPIMEHILALLRENGVEQAHAGLHYLADEIEAYFGDGSDFGLRLDYSVEDTPLGTAGSVKRLQEHLEGTFVVISGDALCDFDLGAAIHFHREKGSAATLVLTRVAEPREFGVVITDEEQRVQRFLEKPSWGEVFSDTVNTGIYVLEPQVLDKIDPEGQVDFSGDLFPALLKEGWPLYGYVAEGYWCDIGSLEQYRQANVDCLEGRVRCSILGRETKPDERIWIGEGAQIHPQAHLEAPVVIGHNTVIGEGVHIGSCSVIGDNCVVEPGAAIDRTVVWNNAYVGRGARLSGATVCQNVVIKANSVVSEGAVVGDKCLLGEGSTIQPGVKLWPNKAVEPGARVTMSLVWGTKWPGNLFGGLGVSGLANIEVTPEFAGRLGAAFGAYLERGCQVITSRDSHHVSRMTKRALISGLMSVGANILDLRTMPAPVARHMTAVSGASGGLHVSLSPRDPDQALIQFFDAEGKNLDRAAERKIEAIFAREDFRRSHRDAVGSLEFLSRTVEYYTEDFLNFIDGGVIQSAGFKIVVDYAHGPLCLLMPLVLGRLGIESVALNAFVDPTRREASGLPLAEKAQELADVVAALHADLGVVADNPGERIWLVDEKGRPLAGDELLACFASLAMEGLGEGCKIAVPVSASATIEQLAHKHKAQVIRTRADARSLMETAGREPGLMFAGNAEGGFIFPEFQTVFDTMVSLGKLLEFVARSGRKLSEVRESLPPIYKHKAEVQCPWEQKAAVMRQLHEQVQGLRTDHLDGLKVYLDTGWVLILPDVEAPLLHVFGESTSAESAHGLIDEWCERIEKAQQEL
ncbi:MAG: NTP transferase domain-containing protein [Armatimonadetes bacterium]|nr:NTP transferase domain-containing protein [Armatimonadota bacterium]NIM23220.1 NTP transferase domain-containing protein [Armatimonadota bacterium]NIM67088.1 NTP transferase domain-containing protein [Armatimonadota bacterium]NIM75615.1 NTP transferase domain-containing protein [Armatimonadota bacterium]NIN05277.1 NTP transferase domain-containing protein [Armatimonadota bacterium]